MYEADQLHVLQREYYRSYIVSLITDEGLVPEMRIWSILLIKSDLKWCIYLGRSLFLYICKVVPLQNVGVD